MTHENFSLENSNWDNCENFSSLKSVSYTVCIQHAYYILMLHVTQPQCSLKVASLREEGVAVL